MFPRYAVVFWICPSPLDVQEWECVIYVYIRVSSDSVFSSSHQTSPATSCFLLDGLFSAFIYSFIVLLLFSPSFFFILVWGSYRPEVRLSFPVFVLLLLFVYKSTSMSFLMWPVYDCMWNIRIFSPPFFSAWNAKNHFPLWTERWDNNRYFLSLARICTPPHFSFLFLSLPLPLPFIPSRIRSPTLAAPLPVLWPHFLWRVQWIQQLYREHGLQRPCARLLLLLWIAQYGMASSIWLKLTRTHYTRVRNHIPRMHVPHVAPHTTHTTHSTLHTLTSFSTDNIFLIKWSFGPQLTVEHLLLTCHSPAIHLPSTCHPCNFTFHSPERKVTCTLRLYRYLFIFFWLIQELSSQMSLRKNVVAHISEKIFFPSRCACEPPFLWIFRALFCVVCVGWYCSCAVVDDVVVCTRLWYSTYSDIHSALCSANEWVMRWLVRMHSGAGALLACRCIGWSLENSAFVLHILNNYTFHFGKSDLQLF